jgi:dihydropteroate synthase
MYWRLRTRTLHFGRRPMLMGIINVTPDSFSDGGRFLEPRAAIDHGLRLAAEGADLLDVGGESTRPYSTPVPEVEELRRVLPVVQALAEQTGLPLSIDTSKAVVAREALTAGAEIVNDVTALRGDPAMLPLVLRERPGLCLMHMQGTPQDMQDSPTYQNVVDEVYAWLGARLEGVLEAGLERERVALDPGIGFGKTHQHNLDLLAHCGLLHTWGCPLLVGHSRKGFIAHVLNDRQCDRTFGTIGVALALALQGVQVLRVHDVAAVRQALLLFEASGGLASIDLAEALRDTPRGFGERL